MMTSSGNSLMYQVAEQITTAHSVGEGDKVSISMGGPGAIALARELVLSCYRKGANPQVLAPFEAFEQSALEAASDEVLETPGPLEAAAMEWSDVHVSLRPLQVPTSEKIDPYRLMLLREAKGEISSLRWRCRSWVIVRIPTPEWAELIGIPFDQLLAEFEAGVTQDWDQHGRVLDELCTWLDTTSALHVVMPEGKMSFPYRGRTWMSFAGKANLPDGEVATAPLEREVTGAITFPGKLWFGGKLVEDLSLEFEKGKARVVGATAGADDARALINMDEGAPYVGELGIGTNPGMHRMTGDLFFDEKILGTFHFALGRAYPECGGTNRSSLHWDIVRDLRMEGCYLYADDVTLIDNGRVTGPLAKLCR